MPAHLPDTAATTDLSVPQPQVKMLIMLVVNPEFQDHSAYRNDLSENMSLEENYTLLIIGQNENVEIILMTIQDICPRI